MANLIETSTWENGIYRIETTDDVIGGETGISNAQAKQLGNRTLFLKTAYDGVLTKSVAGGVDVTLTTAEANNGILVFTGALTANISVIVPNTGQWAVRNQTTGSYTLTVKTSAGTGVAVSQNQSYQLYADGTNVGVAGVDAYTKTETDTAFAPLASPAFTGMPAAPTPAQFDNGTSLATTEFVQLAGLKCRTVLYPTTTTALGVSAVGALVFANSASDITLTLPPLDNILDGQQVYIFAYNTGKCTITPDSGDLLYVARSGAIASLELNQGDSLIVTRGNATDWLVVGGSGSLRYAAAFTSYHAVTTATTIPSSYLNGHVNVASGSPFTVTLPSAVGPPGQSIRFFNGGAAAVTIVPAATQIIVAGLSTPASIVLGAGDTLDLTMNGGGAWYAFGGSAALPYASLFGASLASNGFQKLPSGFIIQKVIQNITVANTLQTVNFPISFPASGSNTSVVTTVINGTSTAHSSWHNTPSSSSVQVASSTTGFVDVVAIGW